MDGRVEDQPAPAAGLGVQFRQPDLLVEPGQEVQWCSIPDWTPDKDYLVRSFEGFQNGMGHHIVALRSGIPRQAGAGFDCTDLDSMPSLRLLVAPETAIAPQAIDIGFDGELFPSNFAVRLAKDTVIVMQSHYINYGDEPMVVSDVANLYFVPDEDVADTVVASYFTVNHGFIDVPAGDSDYTDSYTCTVDEDVQLISLLGHMHDWGRWIRIEREKAEGVKETLYEIDEWDVEFRDLAPIAGYSESAPLLLKAGDKITVTCNYDNTRDENLTFPTEMCVAFEAYFPAHEDGDILCE